MGIFPPCPPATCALLLVMFKKKVKRATLAALLVGVVSSF